MSTMRFCFLLLALLGLVGCQRHYVSVSQQWVDGTYLASSKVGTPDPRTEHPPLGQMLVVDWFLPREILKEKPHVELEIIFWDYTKKTVSFPIKTPLSWVTYRCLNEEYEHTGGILTYRAAVVTEEGKIFRQWKHQLWVNLIQIGEEENLRAP